ncbi:Cell division protein kinase 1 [Quaeritorhiza haematococci]|nr:Cell division protein kinase 1 [Quaeritorhiza haematococci]
MLSHLEPQNDQGENALPFSVKQEKEIWKSYRKVSELGCGVYGKVFKARCRQENLPRAIKKTPIDRDQNISTTTMREIALLKRINSHENVISLFGVGQYLKDPNTYTIMDCGDTDLRHYLDDHPEGLPQDEIKNIMFQTLQGLDHCHSRGVLHRDLKPGNIVISILPTGTLVKVADWGMGRGISIPAKCYTPELVTLLYRAPEIFLGVLEYGAAVDIWSAACIFAELVNGQPLLSGHDELSLLHDMFIKLGHPTYDDFPTATTHPLYPKGSKPESREDELRERMISMEAQGLDLMKKMLIYNPKHRIIAASALAHPYFEEIPGYWNRVEVHEREMSFLQRVARIGGFESFEQI